MFPFKQVTYHGGGAGGRRVLVKATHGSWRHMPGRLIVHRSTEKPRGKQYLKVKSVLFLIEIFHWHFHWDISIWLPLVFFSFPAGFPSNHRYVQYTSHKTRYGRQVACKDAKDAKDEARAAVNPIHNQYLPPVISQFAIEHASFIDEFAY